MDTPGQIYEHSIRLEGYAEAMDFAAGKCRELDSVLAAEFQLLAHNCRGQSRRLVTAANRIWEAVPPPQFSQEAE